MLERPTLMPHMSENRSCSLAIFHEGPFRRGASFIAYRHVRASVDTFELREVRDEEDMDETKKGNVQTHQKIKNPAPCHI